MTFVLQCQEDEYGYGVDVDRGTENATCPGSSEPLSLVCVGVFDELTVTVDR